MPSAHDRVREALDALAAGLQPFAQAELEAAYGDAWEDKARESLRNQKRRCPPDEPIHWDAQAVLSVVWDRWHAVFRHRLGPGERSLVGELRHFRNRWAHQDAFDLDDACRVLDTVHRLLVAVAGPGAEAVGEQWLGLWRERLDGPRRARRARRLARSHIDTVVFVICGVALGLQVLISFGGGAWPVALLAGVSFAYILVRRLIAEREETPPCPRCPPEGEAAPAAAQVEELEVVRQG